MRLKTVRFLPALTLLLTACSSTKYVSEGQYLLNKATISTDHRVSGSVVLEDYLRQKPNAEVPLLGKVRLRTGNLKWVRKILPKFVEKPVIYSPSLTKASAEQLRLEVSNRGFLRATVDTSLVFKGKKAEVKYIIRTGEAYKIRSITNEIADSTIHRMVEFASKGTLIKSGDVFNIATLDNEKSRLTQMLNNAGYYGFTQDYLYYKADTTVGNHKADIALNLYPAPDSTEHVRYKVGRVTVLSGYDPTDRLNDLMFANPDTVMYRGIRIVRGNNRFLKPEVIFKNNFLRPGEWYADWRMNATLSSFATIGAVKQTNITLNDTIRDDGGRVNAEIVLPKANVHSLQTALEGTNSAGDIGAALSIAYKHQNLFNGAEVLGIKLKGAYEFVSGSESYDLTSQNFYEYGIETSLTFPQIIAPFVSNKIKERPMASTQFSVGLTNQHRPEYDRQFFNATLSYQWTNWAAGLSHNLEVQDVNYVRMPRVSDTFRKNYLENSKYPLLKYSYEDQLIARTAYSVTFTGKRQYASASTYTIRASLDVGGVVPRIVTLLGGATKNSDGAYQIAGIRYAEYSKLDLSFAKNITVNNRLSVAYRVALGVAKPYGNSEILPFEKRYFSGGSNSVRGWATRRLGPGFYHPDLDSVEYANQVGDIKLDLGVEVRRKLGELFQLALFVDAGNIWAIDNNSNTVDGGLFRFSQFYKQIALSYGAGLRLDLGFLLLRLDGGFKAFDPGQSANHRWRFSHFAFKRDFALHFGIGYPF